MNFPAPDHNPNPGRMMLWLGALGLLAALVALFQLISVEPGGIVQTVNESGRTMVVLQRDRSGHYLAEGKINDLQVTFLVDTGATDVALPESTARQLGLEFGPEVVVMTAGGPMGAWMTRLDRVTVGDLTLTNVRGTITRGPLEDVLLGMSFLRHFTITQQGDRLLIESGE
jgi:aspartyl protease family protein